MQITFVAILGGGQGSEFERKQLEDMDKLFKGRRMMEKFIDMAVKDVACCVTLGWLTPGYNSAIYWVQRIGAWLAFCTSVGWVCAPEVPSRLGLFTRGIVQAGSMHQRRRVGWVCAPKAPSRLGLRTRGTE